MSSALPPFTNEPLTDFSVESNRTAFREALELVRSQLGTHYPLVIGDERIETKDTLPSINPARPKEVVGVMAEATKADAARAIEIAHEAFLKWQHVDAHERARYLLRAAAEMRKRKHEFSAWMVFEIGKSWAEADADTAEAIDFMDYYARQAIRLTTASEQLVQAPGEQLALQYIGLGVCAVIPPWNFPNAIMAGMTSAAIVSGNSVVLKPAGITPIIAYKLCELFWKQGLPPGVLNFVPGPGAEIGDTMVDHPKTRFIAFTGSKEVGMRIFERAARVHPGQLWLKRTILEMGGKDAVIVDETADLNAAAEGIVASAFGFQGQKCSAGSRAIIVKSVYETVAKRVVERTKKLRQDAPDKGADVHQGPVSDERAFKKIMKYIEIGAQEGTLLCGGKVKETPDDGYFIEPTIFGDVPGDARIAQEEIFGPVLALIPVADFDEALAVANSTEFGLTGAVYSQNRERLERARREYHVGNLYFNRKCTGALVGVNPFGGFNMSGTDSKAGGPDYLLLFTQAKSIAEKL
ncbi:MAG TPA: L-glutamate gamma-semialdehyde dehydrogenase [Aggregatilineales bacterium]|nr:L-glutamate gamma-semialdehyde dehydrogenase [Anaerolineales bacterium]HRE47294.1 L-glutamate gamma-semialdehyde dehydrogenase [Aggregatilineales bacterium]